MFDYQQLRRGRATTINYLIINSLVHKVAKFVKFIKWSQLPYNYLIISDLRRRGHKVAAATENGRHSQSLDYQHITQSNQQ